MHLHRNIGKHIVCTHTKAVTERDCFSFSKQNEVILQKKYRKKYFAVITLQTTVDFFLESSRIFHVLHILAVHVTRNGSLFHSAVGV